MTEKYKTPVAIIEELKASFITHIHTHIHTYKHTPHTHMYIYTYTCFIYWSIFLSPTWIAFLVTFYKWEIHLNIISSFLVCVPSQGHDGQTVTVKLCICSGANPVSACWHDSVSRY